MNAFVFPTFTDLWLIISDLVGRFTAVRLIQLDLTLG
jgi:hypothetical protein